MSATILQLRDYDARRPADGEVRGPAVVLILPVIRVVREIEVVLAEASRRQRRSLLGEP